jgi:hypothetical protein
MLKETEGEVAIRYFAAPHQQGMALQPVLQQLERDSRMRPGDPPAMRLARLRSILPDLPPVEFALVAEQMGLQLPYYKKISSPIDVSAMKRRNKNFSYP